MKNLPLITIKAILLSTLLSTAVSAHDERQNERRKEHERRIEREEELNTELSDRIRIYGPKKNHARTPRRGPLQTIACGDIIDSSVTINNDIDCTGMTGFALRIIGDNLTINGNGHRIIAPNAAAGLFVQGANNTIVNFNIQGVAQGYGMLAYNASSIKVISNNFSNNSIGIMIYADAGETQYPKIFNNVASFNSFAGIRTYSDFPGSINNPQIRNNDFRSSGEFALYIKSENYEISGDDKNNLDGSSNGFYLKDGRFKISEFSLTKQLIYKRIFFVDSAQNILFRNVNLASLAPLTSSQERVGIDLYKVDHFQMINVRTKNHDVGLKLETEGGVETEGSLRNCRFSNHSVSGIYIVSYDDTIYGTIKLMNVRFDLTSPSQAVIIHETTTANIVQINNGSGKDCDKDDDCDDSHDSADRD